MRQALKLALYALEAYRPVIVKRKGLTYSLGDKAITAIKEALAQPEQEPVAWLHTTHSGDVQAFTNEPPPRLKELCKPLYTTPPQRTWVGLTDDDDIDWEEGGNLKDLVKAIEAKLKEKNT